MYGAYSTSKFGKIKNVFADSTKFRTNDDLAKSYSNIYSTDFYNLPILELYHNDVKYNDYDHCPTLNKLSVREGFYYQIEIFFKRPGEELNTKI